MKTERGWEGIKFISETDEEKELLQRLYNSLKDDPKKDESDNYEDGKLWFVTYW